MNKRLYGHIVPLVLTLFTAVVLGVYVLVDKTPELEKSETERLTSAYRQVAEAIQEEWIIDNPVAAIEDVKRPKSARKMKPGRWDYEYKNGKTLVWYAEGERSRAVMVDRIPSWDVKFTMYSLIFGVMVVVVALSVFSICCVIKIAKERADFIAAAAHDLSTPLIGMRMMIGRKDDEAKILNERLIRLVDNIKEFLRLGGVRRKPAREEFNLSDGFYEAYSLFRDDYRDVMNEDLELEVNGLIKVIADRTMTIQIIWNMLGNDLKYAAPYGKVYAKISKLGNVAIFELFDQGKGMSAYERRNAFDRYYRAKTVLDSGKGGFGIGLATSREFARAMGGDLTVSANVPRGCIFTLKLPLA